MNETEIAASVLAAVALPLVGIGPMLLRTLPPSLVGVAMALCAGIVWLLTRAPWATAFTLCIGAAVLLRHRPAPRRVGEPRHEAPSIAGFVAPRADREGGPA